MPLITDDVDNNSNNNDVDDDDDELSQVKKEGRDRVYIINTNYICTDIYMYVFRCGIYVHTYIFMYNIYVRNAITGITFSRIAKQTVSHS